MNDNDTTNDNGNSRNPDLGPFPGVMGPHTAKAVERLKTGQPGDALTRAQMADVIGRSCELHSNGYGNVNSAINHVEREHGVIWRWDKGLQAWKCLHDHEKVGDASGKIKRSRKLAKRAIRVAAHTDASKLSDDQRREHNLNTAQAGLLYLFGGGPFRKRLKQAALPNTHEPEVGKVIELMKPRG
jgi:hypothetical protein